MFNDESITRIDLFCSVAKLNDSALSLSDLRLLLQPELTLAELEEVFSRSPALSSRYQLRSGFVFERGDGASVSTESEKKKQASRNIALGTMLAKRLRGKGSVVIAISGSTSYESVKSSDDLDLFCITRDDSAWVFMTKALLILRASRVLSRRYSTANVSCVMDLSFAERDFGREQDALFARDGLNAIVIEGDAQYNRLLRRATWMSKFFPRLYAHRSSSAGAEDERKPSTPLTRLSNLFLFHTVGRYVRIRSMLENRRLSRYGADGRAFVTMMGGDHCIYESLRYRRMREIYRRI